MRNSSCAGLAVIQACLVQDAGLSHHPFQLSSITKKELIGLTENRWKEEDTLDAKKMHLQPPYLLCIQFLGPDVL